MSSPFLKNLEEKVTITTADSNKYNLIVSIAYLQKYIKTKILSFYNKLNLFLKS